METHVASVRFRAVTCLTGLAAYGSTQRTTGMMAEILERLVRHEKDPKVLVAAINLLPAVDPSGTALSSLVMLLDDTSLRGHPDIPRAVLLGAGRMGPGAISFLLASLAVHPEAAMLGLAANGSDAAVHALVGEINNVDAAHRLYAVHALGATVRSGRLSEPASALVRSTLMLAQFDTDGNVRRQAVEFFRQDGSGLPVRADIAVPPAPDTR